jgi:deoxycytidine triphosphate deaminase
MFGTLLNNSQIVTLIADRKIQIDPFDKKKLRVAHYPLTLRGLIELGDITNSSKRIVRNVHDFSAGMDGEFEPNQYLIGEVSEYIFLDEGFVGQFTTTSIMIELGFLIVAGKIDPGYGKIRGKRQHLRFGIKNLHSVKNSLPADIAVAHISIFDLRALNNYAVKFSPIEIQRILDRHSKFERFGDDGPNYEE